MAPATSPASASFTPRCSMRAPDRPEARDTVSRTGSSSAGHRGPNCACCARARAAPRGRPERAIRQRQRVVGGAELGKERDGALEVAIAPVVIAPGGVEPAEAELARRARAVGSAISPSNSRWLSSSAPDSNSASASPTRAGR